MTSKPQILATSNLPEIRNYDLDKLSKPIRSGSTHISRTVEHLTPNNLSEITWFVNKIYDYYFLILISFLRRFFESKFYYKTRKILIIFLNLVRTLKPIFYEKNLKFWKFLAYKINWKKFYFFARNYCKNTS